MYVLAPLFALFILAGVPLLWRRRRVLYRVAAALLTLLAVLILGFNFYAYWFTHRPQPAPLETTLFQGVTYVRAIRSTPRPLVIHVVRVELATPGLEFLVTPGVTAPAPGHEVEARTTSQFLDEFDLQLAINGDYFLPWWSRNPWDYYPHPGDPVDVRGPAVSRGTAYSTNPANARWPALYLTAANEAAFDPLTPIHNALSGNPLFLNHGRTTVAPAGSDDYNGALHPRTSVALDAERRTLILIIVDGRQPNYSEGATLADLAAIARDYGADTALNLDGGGSSTLVVEGPDGRPQILNTPIDNHIPGRERPVANHLGIYARKP